MKNQILLIVLFTFLLGSSYAQTIPQGMNYQAVARDNDGQILANQDVFLKISLISDPGKASTLHYTETQKATTNKFGLFTLTIGKGSVLAGQWSKIPWSTKEVWMDVAIKLSANEDYVSLSRTQLLAVPYAYYAGSAGNSGTIGATSPGGNSWNTPGNLSTNPLTDYVGTADSTDLRVNTNKI